jgi:hypothetical protein
MELAEPGVTVDRQLGDLADSVPAAGSVPDSGLTDLTDKI